MFPIAHAGSKWVNSGSLRITVKTVVDLGNPYPSRGEGATNKVFFRADAVQRSIPLRFIYTFEVQFVSAMCMEVWIQLSSKVRD